MAMNKAEQRTMEAALLEVQMQRALRLDDIPEPDLPAPTVYGTVTRGYMVNTSTGKVEYVQSGTTSHRTASDSEPMRGCGTQGSRDLYSSLDVAIRAGQQYALRRMALELLGIEKNARREFA